MTKVILRDFNPDSDTGLIYDTYPKGVYYGSAEPITTPKSEWFTEFFKVAKGQLQTAQIHIACLSDDPDFALGYSIIQDGQLEFVYVKKAYRNKGIATLLTKNKYQSINPANLTRVGKAILQKNQEKELNETNSAT